MEFQSAIIHMTNLVESDNSGHLNQHTCSYVFVFKIKTSSYVCMYIIQSYTFEN